jgi:RecB family exonuclease
MHSTIAASIVAFWRSAPGGASPPSIAVVVPTVSAGEALRRTLERLSPASARAEIVTREDFYARLHQGVAGEPPMLSPFEREVLLIRAAEHATASGAPAPFRLRPGLVTEILSFYDELRRRDRTVADFDRLMSDSLQPSVEIDRGAERLYRQTRFLAKTFAELERLVERSGRLDEHTLRALLLQQNGKPTYTHVVVTVADQAADPRGLWTADFDLLARLSGIVSIDVIATENLLAAGFHQRAHDVFPGIEEERRGSAATPPMLLAPAAAETNEPRYWFVCRDREEELVDVARIAAQSEAPDRIAVVFQRPLPYLYLACAVFDDAEQEYQALDALPLAAEPFAAALDLIFAFLLAEANRSSTIDLLGSPHWRFSELDGSDLSVRAQVAALDTLLRERKYLGGWDTLEALSTERAAAVHAARAAVAAGKALRAVRDAPRASDQIQALLDFVRAYERLPTDESSWASRHLRTRAAVIDALEALAVAHANHDDRALPVERLAGSVRRWIEGQTFAPTGGLRGVMLLDAQAASYASVDEARLVGLIENDWPDRVRRSIFYPSNLLSQLGWPSESERLAAARARFHDLLRLPTTRISASTFTLEDDAIVPPSSFLEDLERSGLAVTRTTERADRYAFRHELLIEEPTLLAAELGAAGEWLALRRSRSSPDAPAYHGAAGPRDPGVYAISHLERYLDCPFKYFSARVLDLDEERDDESGLTPQERGQLLHEVFQSFFARWHEQGGRAITADTLADALELFAVVAENTIARLPEADRALERTYLLGSAAAGGLGERAFNFEIEQETPVLERLLEHPLEGTFEFRGPDGPVRIRIRAKADRIDLLEDGTLRVIDYKLGRAPKTARALQLPVYGVCAEQRLEGRHGRDWKLSRAGYVAFKEKNAFVSLSGPSSPLDQALAEGEQRLVQAVAAIERGEFPVRPDEPFLCTRCGYAGVCRKDYVGDE